MNKITALIVLLLVTAHISAKHVDQSKAAQVAYNFVSANSSAKLRSASDLQLIYTAIGTTDSVLRSSGLPLFYIYNVSGESGFVIVSADDNISPILAYADNGSFHIDKMPANLKKWLQVYEKEISWALNKGYSASDETTKKWNSLTIGTEKSATNGVLLSTALWDQLEPYNNLCPVYNGEKTVAGCVATAMGILMKYYQWPLKGKGEVSYTTETHKIAVKADFNVDYDWDNILDAYTERNGFPQWNKEQGNAIATLIYHTGASAYMDYDTEASGAYSSDVVKALVDNFDYDKSMYLAYRELYSAEEWHELLQNELDEKRPLLYGGVTSDREGHQFIIDGYNSSNYYHLNWGWSGLANGYYLISSLEPNWQGTGGSKEGEGFSFEQDVILGVQKAKRGSSRNHEFYFIEQDFIESSNLENFDVYGLSTNVEKIEKDKPFLLYYSYLWDYGFRDFNGSFGFFIVDKEGNRKEELDVFIENLFAEHVLYYDKGITYTITSDIEEGDKIRMFYSSDGKAWKPVRGKNNTNTVVELPLGTKIGMSNEQVYADQTVKVSPTITSSTINIQSKDDSYFSNIKLFDFAGRLVKDLNYSSGETNTTISVNDLKAGIYIISIETSNGIKKYKIIKQ